MSDFGVGPETFVPRPASPYTARGYVKHSMFNLSAVQSTQIKVPPRKLARCEIYAFWVTARPEHIIADLWAGQK